MKLLTRAHPSCALKPDHQASQPNLPAPPDLPLPKPTPELPVEPKPGKAPLPIDPYPKYEDVPPPKPIDWRAAGNNSRLVS
jgi:hypothetical protein